MIYDEASYESSSETKRFQNKYFVEALPPPVTNGLLTGLDGSDVTTNNTTDSSMETDTLLCFVLSHADGDIGVHKLLHPPSYIRRDM